MLIDDLLPTYQFAERHETRVAAPAGRVYAELRRLDLSRSRIIAGLLWLRRLPARMTGGAPARLPARLTMEGVLGDGFVVLGEDPPAEIVLGTIGRFWRPSGELQKFAAKEFATLSAPGCARAAWNFSTAEVEGGTMLTTETRVQCLDDDALRSFRRYWFVVRPFSGLIRREMLKAVKRAAED